MLSPQNIVTQLQECLPLLTDRFHDQLPVTSGLVTSGTLLLEFPEPHGLVSGDKIFLNDVLIRNKIVNIIVNADQTVSYITENEHDLTAYSSYGHGNTWEQGLAVNIIQGTAETLVNIVPDSSGIPNSMEFVGVIGSPVLDLLDDDAYLLEYRSIGANGLKIVDTVPDETSITIDLSDVPSIPDGDLIIGEVIANIRVAHVANIQRAEQIYTEQGANKAWIFVIMLDRQASKSRFNDDDFISLPGSAIREIDIMQDYSTVCFVPCSNDLGASEAKSWTYVELFTILSKCLYGWEYTGYVGDGQAVYNTAYYSQAYQWQSRARIDYMDGYLNNKTVALRTINFAQTVNDKGVSNGTIRY